MNAWLVIFWVFILGGFGAAGDWVRNMVSDHHDRKTRKLKAAEQARKELEAANRPPEPICGCTHHLSKHGKDGCHESVMTPVSWDAKRKPVTYEERRCNCQQYVGPEPLGTIYAPEVF
jgi:hypothetical protein